LSKIIVIIIITHNGYWHQRYRGH